MERREIVQTVAVLVVAAALLRCLPRDGGVHWLGRGGPRWAWDLDSQMAASLAHRDMSRARLRGATPLDAARWGRWLGLVRDLQEQLSEKSTVQVKGVPRNEAWILQYDLYPHRLVGGWREAGSRVTDATLPGVSAVLIGGDSPRLELVR